MTTGEEGITSDFTVELWGSGGAAGVNPAWTGAGRASAGQSAVAGLLATGTFVEQSRPLWENSVEHLQRVEKKVCKTNQMEIALANYQHPR